MIIEMVDILDCQKALKTHMEKVSAELTEKLYTYVTAHSAIQAMEMHGARILEVLVGNFGETPTEKKCLTVMDD